MSDRPSRRLARDLEHCLTQGLERAPRTAFGAALVLSILVASSAVAAQPAPRHPTDRTITAIDELVLGDRLISLEREACDARDVPERRDFAAGECAALVLRDLASAAIVSRLALPIPIRGLVQLEPFDVDGSGRGLLLRAYDRACLISERGALVATFQVPPSTLEDPVRFDAAHGALVFQQAGCSAFVLGRNELASPGHLHGAESHIYFDLSQPHDTVCFGFGVQPIGELRVGTRPAGRGRHGERRHALATRVLVLATGAEAPVGSHAPTLLAFERGGLTSQQPVGRDGEVVEHASLEGDRVVVIVSDGTSRRRVELDARSGRRLEERTLPAEPAASSPTTPSEPLHYDRRGLVVSPFARCGVHDEGARHVVRFDGVELFASSRPTLVIDQRGERCVAVELGGGPESDTIHLVGP